MYILEVFYKMLSRFISRKCYSSLINSKIAKKSPTSLPKKPSEQHLKEAATVNPSLLRQYLPENDPLLEDDYFNVSKLFTIQDLFDARVHLGHKMGTLDSNMKWALFGHRLDVCIFDLNITRLCLVRALNFVAHVVSRGGLLLFVTAARIPLIEKQASEMGEYSHCRKWINGTLTDSKSMFGCEIRHPDAIILLSTHTAVIEPHWAIHEAAKLAIPTVAIIDSNCSPNYITYQVPGNDDSKQSIELYMRLFKQTVLNVKKDR